MVKQVTFINRERELAQISEIIEEWGTRRLVCVNASGGIGKTRLLQEIYRRHVGKRAKLFVMDIIDLDDRALHAPRNIVVRIINQIGKNVFGSYLQGLQDYRKMEIAGVSPERLEKEKRNIHQILVREFNEFSSRRRIVFLVDTVDHRVLETGIVFYIAKELVLSFKNCVFLVAGREADGMARMLQPELGEEVQMIELTELDPVASEIYLQQKQDLLHIALKPDLTHKLLLLAQGRPILIDLAVEWLAHEIPLGWLIESDLENLKSLSDTEMKKYQEEFESKLVGHIAQIRDSMDRLILAISNIYPLDLEMIADLLKLHEEEAESLFEEAQNYSFMKSLPDQRISLHDEMRRMVNEYVWPQVDPDRSRRCRDSSVATTYFTRKIRVLQDRIDQYKVSSGIDITEALAEIERNYWSMQVYRVRYALQADWPQGIDTFAEVFDEATRRYQFDTRGLLLNSVNENLQTAIERSSHDQDSRYKYEIRLVQHRLDARDDLAGVALILRSLIEDTSEPERQVDILTRRANCARLLGNLSESVKYLEQGLDICSGQQNMMMAWGGAVLNTLGWIHRLMGSWEEAARYYRQSIDLIRETGNEAQLAAAYNNLGYTIGFQRDYDRGLVYSRRALEIQDRLGLTHDAGRTHNTLGVIFRGKESYIESLRHSDQAIYIFEKFEDEEWISTAYCDRGITRWHMGELNEAEADLEKSQRICEIAGLRSELVRILHSRGHVASEQGRIEEAEQYHLKSAEIGREVLDLRQTVNSLEGLVELYYDIGYRHHQQGDTDQREMWYVKAEDMAEQWTEEFEKQGYYFPLYSGSRIRILGNIAYDREDYSTALARYLDAYPRIASPWGYSKYMLPSALDRLQERIDQLPPQLALEWCEQIQSHWEAQGLERDYPEMISVCEIGRDNAARRATKQGEKDRE